ncbi:MAG: hypothetical protein EGR07_05680 [Prevotella sp.]|nr:hypothetical protein [Prevotella sp.]MBD8994190.1 hypothetical protein [Prevotella sp.]
MSSQKKTLDLVSRTSLLCLVVFIVLVLTMMVVLVEMIIALANIILEHHAVVLQITVERISRVP